MASDLQSPFGVREAKSFRTHLTSVYTANTHMVRVIQDAISES